MEYISKIHKLCENCRSVELDNLSWDQCLHAQQNWTCQSSWCSPDLHTHQHQSCDTPWCSDCKRFTLIPQQTIYCSFCLKDPTKPHLHNGIIVLPTNMDCHNKCLPTVKICFNCDPTTPTSLWDFNCELCGCYFGPAPCKCEKCFKVEPLKNEILKSFWDIFEKE
jgi:hypothetical protein